MTGKRVLLLFLLLIVQKEAFSQIINEIATKVSGYEIPILINLPSNTGLDKRPVYFLSMVVDGMVVMKIKFQMRVYLQIQNF